MSGFLEFEKLSAVKGLEFRAVSQTNREPSHGPPFENDISLCGPLCTLV